MMQISEGDAREQTYLDFQLHLDRMTCIFPLLCRPWWIRVNDDGNMVYNIRVCSFTRWNWMRTKRNTGGTSICPAFHSYIYQMARDIPEDLSDQGILPPLSPSNHGAWSLTTFGEAMRRSPALVTRFSRYHTTHTSTMTSKLPDCADSCHRMNPEVPFER
jgi:hypothetical protein